MTMPTIHVKGTLPTASWMYEHEARPLIEQLQNRVRELEQRDQPAAQDEDVVEEMQHAYIDATNKHGICHANSCCSSGMAAALAVARRGMVPAGEVSDVIAHDMAGATELRTAYESLRKEKLVAQFVTDQATIINALLLRLHKRLVAVMKPNYDDSITGFNDAMDVVRDALKNPVVLTRRADQPAAGLVAELERKEL